MVSRLEFALVIAACVCLIYAIGISRVGAHNVQTSIYISICGDGLIQTDEVCDDGAANNSGAYGSSTAQRHCVSDCQSFGPYCGDSVLQVRFTEQCDDGNNTSGDLCSASCTTETPVPPAGIITGSPSKGPVPPSNATEGTIPGETGTKVVLRGKAFPNGDIGILLDGKKIGTVRADSNADFFYSATGLTAGTANFGFLATDQSGVQSILFTTVFEIIESAVTTVANVFIPPTIAVDSKQVTPGDLLKISGQSVPTAKIITDIPSAKISMTSEVDESGAWAMQVDTGSFKTGYHNAKSYFQISSQVKSGYGKSLSFYVGSGAPPGQATCDLNADTRCNLIDFSIFLTMWGTDNPRGDFNTDGTVNLADFSILLFNWTG